MDVITMMQTPTPRASLALDLDRSVFAEGAGVYAAGMRHARNRAGLVAPIGGAVACDSFAGSDVVSTAVVITDRFGDEKGTRLGSAYWSPPV